MTASELGCKRLRFNGSPAYQYILTVYPTEVTLILLFMMAAHSTCRAYDVVTSSFTSIYGSIYYTPFYLLHIEHKRPCNLALLGKGDAGLAKRITLFTLIHDPINGKPDIIVLYQARDNAYAQISAHAQHAGCFFRLYW